MNDIVNHTHCSLEDRANYTFLAPHLTIHKFSISVQARQLGTCPGATRRSVVSFTWTQNKILTVDSVNRRRYEQLDMIDFLTALASYTCLIQRLPDSPGEVG